MQRKDSTPPPRRRQNVLEEVNAEGGLTRAARPAPREMTGRGGLRQLRQAPPPHAAEPTGLLGEWLRNPGNLRRAMLLQIILGPPKALSPDEELS